MPPIRTTRVKRTTLTTRTIVAGSARPVAPRAVIVSASVGAGHDGAADELRRLLEADGLPVDRYDFLDLLPCGLGKLLSRSYHQLLCRAPVGYQRIYAATECAGRPAPAVRALIRSAERRMLKTVTPDTAVVVSTYPGASQVLGALRRRGALAVPVVTYLTDFSVHTLWVAPGVDVHLAAHPVPAGQAEARGAAGVRVCGPVVGPRFGPPTEAQRCAARLRFGPGESAPLALLVAGSWGVGEVEQAAADILDSGAAVPVVVCGRNEALAARLREQGVAHVHGWVSDMPDLMHACDVLVQNAGGLTSLEAFASGLPVASYRCIPGHGQTNAAALQEAGLAVWIRDRAALGPTLTDLLTGPGGRHQRARGLDLFRNPGGPARAIAALAGHPVRELGTLPQPVTEGAVHPVPARLRTRARRIMAGIPTMVVVTLVTLLLGIGAPLAEAYGDSSVSLGSLAHFLDGNAR